MKETKNKKKRKEEKHCLVLVAQRVTAFLGTPEILRFVRLRGSDTTLACHSLPFPPYPNHRHVHVLSFRPICSCILRAAAILSWLHGMFKVTSRGRGQPPFFDTSLQPLSTRCENGNGISSLSTTNVVLILAFLLHYDGRSSLVRPRSRCTTNTALL